MIVGIFSKKRSLWIDAVLFILVIGLIYAIMHLGKAMVAPYTPSGASKPLDLSIWKLPYYAGLSVLRMFIAFAASIIFTLIYGYLAAKNKVAEKILIPLLDIFQSVPVLGFLSITVTLFVSIFKGNSFGLELACLFAIFTAQVWNMIFSFYQSLTAIPKELSEAADVMKLNWYQKMIKLEIPYSMMGLVWNSMMSFGGTWFFLAASEAITVLGNTTILPGIGSYVAEAINEGNMRAIFYAIIAMIVVIVLIDFLFWKPVVAWAQKYKLETISSGVVPTSFVYGLLVRSNWFKYFWIALAWPFKLFGMFLNFLAKLTTASRKVRKQPLTHLIGKIIGGGIVLYILFILLVYLKMLYHVLESTPSSMYWTIFSDAVLTLIRVIIAVFLGALWTVPAGVAIGLSPKLSRFFQPIIQVAASFPANLIFPFVTILFVHYHMSLSYGAIPLMMLGTQWYILFNVIAGAMAIPKDLLEAGEIFKITGIKRWKKIILPAIFPYLITGCITASGGAWNASILAEVVQWQSTTLTCKGLGSFISAATGIGNWTGIILGIAMMCLFVVVINNVLWRVLYRIARDKFSF
ncbi:MAG: ABC transporter permease subunit [Fusobacteria bacterium]|nr:ABC transporter permease subunit [Fusobacteriota bacterium]